jgi:Na+/H+-translocating membrane pyrophosphatase
MLRAAGCGMVGIVNAYVFVWIAQYYTDYKFRPVRLVAEASTTGHATNIIAGVGLGLESTALPVLVMSAALIASYWLGNTSGVPRPRACSGHMRARRESRA